MPVQDATIQTRDGFLITQFRGFPGGLAAIEDTYIFDPIQNVESIRNFEIGFPGLRARDGFTLDSSNLHADQDDGFDFFYFSLGGKDIFIYIDDDGDIFWHDGLTLDGWTRANDGVSNLTVGTAGRGVAFAALLNDKIYVTSANAFQDSFSFDTESNWVTITDHTLDGSATAEFPHSQSLVVKDSRMFAAVGNQLHFSDLEDPETWPTNNFIIVGDESDIERLIVYGDRMLLFKSNAIFSLGGNDPLTFTLDNVSSLHGTTVGESVVELEGLVYFFSRKDNSVYVTDGSSVEQINKQIQNFMTDNIDDANFNDRSVNGWVFNNKYHLSLAWDGFGDMNPGTTFSNTATFVYDPSIQAWTIYDYGIISSATNGVDIWGVGLWKRLTSTAPDAGVWKLYDGTLDDGDVPRYAFTTHWFAPEGHFLGSYRLKQLLYTNRQPGIIPTTVNVKVGYDFNGDDADRDSITENTIVDFDLDIIDNVLSGWEAAEHRSFQIAFNTNAAFAGSVHGLMDVLFVPRPVGRGDRDGT